MIIDWNMYLPAYGRLAVYVWGAGDGLGVSAAGTRRQRQIKSLIKAKRRKCRR